MVFSPLHSDSQNLPTSESTGGLSPTLHSFCLVGLGRGLRICILTNLQVVPDGAGLGATL